MSYRIRRLVLAFCVGGLTNGVSGVLGFPWPMGWVAAVVIAVVVDYEMSDRRKMEREIERELSSEERR